MDYVHFAKGCVTGAGLIIAIGAQNAFVIKQGLLRNQVFITAFVCAVIDSLLIALGVGGLGKIITSSQILLFIAKWGGAGFLFWYGFKSFRQVFKNGSLKVSQDSDKPSLKATLLTVFAVSLLNPHVYLDTVVLLGSIGSQFEAEGRFFFAIGAIFISIVWFFSLCYGARFLAPLFENPKAWKTLDFIIGVVMWTIGISLLFSNNIPCSV